MIMEPNLSGSFYSSDPHVLREQINQFLLNVELDRDYPHTLGIVSPHAGYIYSGQCAAYGFKAIRNRDVELAVIIAPCHRFIGFEYSVGDFEAYKTPLGKAEVNAVEVKRLLENRKFEYLPQAYDHENSLETQIPFLQVILPEAKILPILIGNQCRNNSMHLAETLLQQFEGRLDKVVFVASSDLSHYHDAHTAEEMDKRVMENVLKRDNSAFLDDIESRRSEACGYGTIMTMIYMSLMTEYNIVENLNYSHSGMISNDNAQVVGYLSSIFYKN